MARRGNFVRWDGDQRIDDPIDQWEGTWQGTSAHDLTGRPITPGMWLVKAYQSGRSCNLEIRQVREVRTVTSKDWDPQAGCLRPAVQYIVEDLEIS